MEEYLCLVVVAKNATTDFSSNFPIFQHILYVS